MEKACLATVILAQIQQLARDWLGPITAFKRLLHSVLLAQIQICGKTWTRTHIEIKERTSATIECSVKSSFSILKREQ